MSFLGTPDTIYHKQPDTGPTQKAEPVATEKTLHGVRTGISLINSDLTSITHKLGEKGLIYQVLEEIADILNRSSIARHSESPLEQSLNAIKEQTVYYNEKTMKWHDWHTNRFAPKQKELDTAAIQIRTGTDTTDSETAEVITNDNYLKQIAENTKALLEKDFGGGGESLEDRMESEARAENRARDTKAYRKTIKGRWETFLKWGKDSFLGKNWKLILAALVLLFAPFKVLKPLWKAAKAFWEMPLWGKILTLLTAWFAWTKLRGGIASLGQLIKSRGVLGAIEHAGTVGGRIAGTASRGLSTLGGVASRGVSALGGGISRGVSALGGGGAVLGGASLLAGVALAIKDGMAGAKLSKEWGTSKTSGVTGAVLGGTDKGLSGAFKNAGKWALIGAGIGSFVPVIGTMIGGLVGAGVGAIMGFFGGEAIAGWIDSIASTIKGWWDSIIGFFAESLMQTWEGVKDIWENGLSWERVWNLIKANPIFRLGEIIAEGIGNLWEKLKSKFSWIPGFGPDEAEAAEAKKLEDSKQEQRDIIKKEEKHITKSSRDGRYLNKAKEQVESQEKIDEARKKLAKLEAGESTTAVKTPPRSTFKTKIPATGLMSNEEDWDADDLNFLGINQDDIGKSGNKIGGEWVDKDQPMSKNQLAALDFARKMGNEIPVTKEEELSRAATKSKPEQVTQATKISNAIERKKKKSDDYVAAQDEGIKVEGDADSGFEGLSEKDQTKLLEFAKKRDVSEEKVRGGYFNYSELLDRPSMSKSDIGYGGAEERARLRTGMDYKERRAAFSSPIGLRSWIKKIDWKDPLGWSKPDTDKQPTAVKTPPRSTFKTKIPQTEGEPSKWLPFGHDKSAFKKQETLGDKFKKLAKFLWGDKKADEKKGAEPATAEDQKSVDKAVKDWVKNRKGRNKKTADRSMKIYITKLIGLQDETRLALLEKKLKSLDTEKVGGSSRWFRRSGFEKEKGAWKDDGKMHRKGMGADSSIARAWSGEEGAVQVANERFPGTFKTAKKFEKTTYEEAEAAAIAEWGPEYVSAMDVYDRMDEMDMEKKRRKIPGTGQSQQATFRHNKLVPKEPPAAKMDTMNQVHTDKATLGATPQASPVIISNETTNSSVQSNPLTYVGGASVSRGKPIRSHRHTNSWDNEHKTTPLTLKNTLLAC